MRILLGLCTCLALAACRSPAPLAGATGTRSTLAQLAQTLDPNMQVGLYVVSVRSGAPVASWHSQRSFVPASSLKLITAAAALEILGPAHRFSTDLLTSGRRGAVLTDLIVRGNGDPELSVGDLSTLAMQLRQQGITHIAGDLLLDDTAFDAVRWGQGWAWEDLREDYSAPVGALNLAGNRMTLTVSPEKIVLDPPNHYVDLQIHTGTPGRLRITPSPADYNQGLQEDQPITITGTLPAHAQSLSASYAVDDGAMFAAAALRDALAQQHITLQGNVRRAATPANAQLLASHASAPLTTQLVNFVKASDNHGMECLTKRMGAVTQAGGGTWQVGTQVIQNFLQHSVGIDVSTVSIQDGSGLSRYNLLTPEQLVQVLRYMHQHFTLGPEFLATLPLGNIDGTLATRFAQLPGRVRAKTGTMGGVSTLAGYVQQDSGETWAFALMMNNFVGAAGKIRAVQERVLEILAAQSY